jgi:glutamate synthase (NADPH/NADH)
MSGDDFLFAAIGSDGISDSDICLLALGFMGPETAVIKALGVEQDGRTNIKTPTGPTRYSTGVPGVFAAGDCRRGQSLIVWGIQEGRACAEEVDRHLERTSQLPLAGGIKRRQFIEPRFTPEPQQQQVGA